MRYAIALILLIIAVGGCANPTAPKRSGYIMSTGMRPVHDTYCTDDPPPGAQILGACPYGSGYIVFTG